MEEFMMMMMMIQCPGDLSTWKLYENPFYCSQHQQVQQQREEKRNSKKLHRLHLPISARKITSSFRDLSFIRPLMVSELDIARSQITELKEELELERKAHKKLESTCKKLSRELWEERRGREASERVCQELALKVSFHKTEMIRIKRETEEERKMLRTAEVLREERVQMQLTEAKLLLGQKILELDVIINTERMQMESTIMANTEAKYQEDNNAKPALSAGVDSLSLQRQSMKAHNNSIVHSVSTRRRVQSMKAHNNSIVHSVSTRRRASPEPENPHIKRGIKGFVEFPKVVRAIGSRSKHLGTNLECQKAQLRILLKQKSHIQSTNLLMS